VFEVTLQTLTLAWSPDSVAFAANDCVASDLEMAYLYDVKTLDRVDVRELHSRRRCRRGPLGPGGVDTAPHSYVDAIRGLDARHVEVQLHGHTEGVRIGASMRPGDGFDLRYRAGRGGSGQKLSQRVFAITANGCE